MSKETLKIETCFIAAAPGTRLETIREALQSRNIRPLLRQDLFTGSDSASEIQRQLLEADLVLGIMPKGKQSPWVLFELGQAWALGKRILLIASPKVGDVPGSSHRFLTLRTEPDNREAIDFALDQLLSSPAEERERDSKKDFPIVGLGPVADDLIHRLDAALGSGNERTLAGLVSAAIRDAGTDVVVESPQREKGADLAVWSDVLEPFVGNPLLIEIKLRIQTRSFANETFKQINRFLEVSSTRWALLLYGEGAEPSDNLWRNCPPNVLVMPVRALFVALRTQSFPEVVRELRNRRVHFVGL